MRPFFREDQIAATLRRYGLDPSKTTVLGITNSFGGVYVNTTERSYRVPADVLGIEPPPKPPERKGLLFTHPEI